MRGFPDKLQSLLLLLSFLFFPFIISSETVDITLTPRLLLLAGVIFLISILTVFGRFGKPTDDYGLVRYSYFYMAVVGYLAIVGISVLVSINTGESLYEWGKRIPPFVLLIYLVRSLRVSTALARNLPVIIAIAGLAVGLIGVAQITSLAFLSLPGNVIPYATMANRNLFASYMILSLPFALIIVRSPRPVLRIIGASTVMVLLFTIMVSQTRAAWVAVAVAGVAALIIAATTRKSQSASQPVARSSGRFSTKRILVLSVLVVLALVFLGNSLADWNLTDRAKSIVNRDDGSIADRLDVWSRSLEMIQEYPILGVGPGQWRVHIAGYGVEGTRSESGVTHFQRPHNDYLWVLCENGPAGLLFYMLIFGIVGRLALNKLVRPLNSNEYWQTVYCLFGLIAYLVVAFFSYPQERVIHQMLLMALIAYLIVTPPLQTRKTRVNAGGMKFALPAAFAISSLVVAIMASARLNSEKEMQKIYKWRDIGRWSEVISATNRAENFFTVMDPTAAPLSWYRGVAQFTLNDRNAAFESFTRAYQINPTHLHVLNNLGTSYELKGDHDRARFYYEQALEISPRFEDAVLNLTAILYNAGQFGQALELIKRIESQNPDPRYAVFLEKIEAALSR